MRDSNLRRKADVYVLQILGVTLLHPSLQGPWGSGNDKMGAANTTAARVMQCQGLWCRIEVKCVSDVSKKHAGCF